MKDRYYLLLRGVVKGVDGDEGSIDTVDWCQEQIVGEHPVGLIMWCPLSLPNIPSRTILTTEGSLSGKERNGHECKTY